MGVEIVENALHAPRRHTSSNPWHSGASAHLHRKTLDGCRSRCFEGETIHESTGTDGCSQSHRHLGEAWVSYIGELRQLSSRNAGCQPRECFGRDAQNQVFAASLRCRKDLASRRRPCEAPGVCTERTATVAGKGMPAFLTLEGEADYVMLRHIIHLIRQRRQQGDRESSALTSATCGEVRQSGRIAHGNKRSSHQRGIATIFACSGSPMRDAASRSCQERESTASQDRAISALGFHANGRTQWQQAHPFSAWPNSRPRCSSFIARYCRRLSMPGPGCGNLSAARSG